MIITRTPFRIPLGGGGTDLPSYYSNHGGALITAAINKYMYININEPAVGNTIRINYSRTEEVHLNNVIDIKHEIVRETLKYLNICRPLEISSMADLSAGTGMGSSSSYTVGLLQGINQMLRRHIPLQDIAEEACKIEIQLIGKPIGKQDQYAATFGGIMSMEIDHSGHVKCLPLDLEQEVIYEMENRMLMFYTGIQRDANIILQEQSDKAKVSESATSEAMHKIKQIGFDIQKSMVSGNLDDVGRLIHTHWTTKKSISTKMSDPNIDLWYELGMKNGALGGKIMGAGGGGFMLFFAKNGSRKKLRSAMEAAGLKYMDFRFDFEGVKTMANL
jgi:D-glycero-alpha-D-manno-heptose-7-phosphate kinase